MDPRKKSMQTLKSNLSLDKRSQNFRCHKSQSCSITQPQVVPKITGKMFMMQSVQTDSVIPTPVSHAETNTSPLLNLSTCTQTTIPNKHMSSQTQGTKIKDTGTQYMYKECRKSLPTKYTHYDVIDKFCTFLEENNQMQDFVSLAKGLIEDKIDPKNLAWQSALHMGQYSACPMMTVMRYEPEYIEFMGLMNLIFGSSALNILQCPTHFGTVISGKAQRSKYDPSESKCNFPVPSYRIMQNLDTGYPKVLKPGIIECTLNICEELTQLHQKQFVLSFDGMQVAPGSKGVSGNGVDLWGADKPISNAQVCSIHQLDMDIVQSLEFPVNINNQIVQSTHLKRLLWRLTKYLQQMRTHLTGKYFVEQKLEKLKDHNPDKVDRFDCHINHIFKNTTQIENGISHTLQMNVDICSILGQLNGSSCCVAENKYVKLHKQPNFFGLLPSEYVSCHMNLEIELNTKYCSQYSILW